MYTNAQKYATHFFVLGLLQTKANKRFEFHRHITVHMYKTVQPKQNQKIKSHDLPFEMPESINLVTYSSCVKQSIKSTQPNNAFVGYSLGKGICL